MYHRPDEIEEHKMLHWYCKARLAMASRETRITKPVLRCAQSFVVIIVRCCREEEAANTPHPDKRRKLSCMYCMYLYTGSRMNVHVVSRLFRAFLWNLQWTAPSRLLVCESHFRYHTDYTVDINL